MLLGRIIGRWALFLSVSAYLRLCPPGLHILCGYLEISRFHLCDHVTPSEMFVWDYELVDVLKNKRERIR